MTERRKSPLRAMINNNIEDIKAIESIPNIENIEVSKFFSIKKQLADKLDDYVYFKQTEDRFLTEKEVISEALKFFLESQGNIPEMPPEAKLRLQERRNKNGRKKKNNAN